MKWETTEIKNACIGIYDGPHATPPMSDDGAIFLGISNITPNGHLDFSDIRYINKLDLPKWTKRVVPQYEDIVFSYEATLNLYAIIPKDFYGCLGRRMALIRPNKEIVNVRFLYYYFFSNEWRATIKENTIVGATVDRIPLIRFPEFKIPLPPLNIQNKIADILSAYDDLIENNRKQLKLLEEAAQRLYKEWFVDLRFPGHENTKIIDGVPEGWKYESIDNFIQLKSGFAFKSDNFVNSGDYKIVTIKNVQDGCFDGANVSRIEKVPSNIPEHCKLKDGDILLSLTGNIGRVCILTGEKYLLNQRVAKLDSMFSGYTYCLFKSREMVYKLCNLANGVAQQNLSPIRTGKIIILKPKINKIELFEKKVKPIIRKIILLNKTVNYIVEARDRLLPKLMSGEIEV